MAQMRSFRGIERGQSHRIFKGLKEPLYFSGSSQLHCREVTSKPTTFLNMCHFKAHLSGILPRVTAP